MIMRKFDYSLIDEIVTKYTYVSLNDNNYYTSTIIVGSVQMKLTCAYNSLNKQRWISLTDSYGNVLLPQTFLKYGRRCELNFNAEISNLHYYVTLRLIDKSKEAIVTNADYDYQYWSQDLVLCFVGFEQELWEQIDDNYRLYLVGQV